MDIPIENPYTEPLRSEFWEMSVRRDLEALLANDWSVTEADFAAEGFLGLDANGSNDPCDWRPAFTTLEDYRDTFNQQASEFAANRFVDDPRAALYSALTITEPIVKNDRATLVKTFDGRLSLQGGGEIVWAWKSLFHLKLDEDRWRFTGFVGYLPI